uniref:Uncharacterized protein n=1 Tax=Anguilla anguilla TaxID=7936 RepID=A0A0E9X1Y3_ANGAN
MESFSYHHLSIQSFRAQTLRHVCNNKSLVQTKKLFGSVKSKSHGIKSSHDKTKSIKTCKSKNAILTFNYI